MDELTDQVAGTQAITRAMLVLRAIASGGRRGMRVADIVAMSALPQATVSRMLAALHREGVVVRDERLRKYFVGPVIHELGLVARSNYALPQACHQAMQWLAEETQDTVYLSERRGAEATCTAAEEGAFPIKAIPLHVGIRRPLGVGAGGLAILAAMAPDHAEEIVRANAPRYPAYGGIDLAYLADALARTRERGWSWVANKATQGMTAVGVAIAGPSGEPVAALSISAISSRMNVDRAPTLASLLLKQCGEISAELAKQSAGRS
ncbi:MAG: IclR family transcriptional regulator [Variovorax sp.]|nr:IclR family transcriptional regulator [Variovorax sp.]